MRVCAVFREFSKGEQKTIPPRFTTTWRRAMDKVGPPGPSGNVAVHGWIYESFYDTGRGGGFQRRKSNGRTVWNQVCARSSLYDLLMCEHS